MSKEGQASKGAAEFTLTIYFESLYILFQSTLNRDSHGGMAVATRAYRRLSPALPLADFRDWHAGAVHCGLITPTSVKLRLDYAFCPTFFRVESAHDLLETRRVLHSITDFPPPGFALTAEVGHPADEMDRLALRAYFDMHRLETA